MRHGLGVVVQPHTKSRAGSGKSVREFDSVMALYCRTGLILESIGAKKRLSCESLPDDHRSVDWVLHFESQEQRSLHIVGNFSRYMQRGAVV